MTSKETVAAKATAYIVALIVVVYVLPAFILGGWWVSVAVIATGFACIIAGLILLIWFTLMAVIK